MKIYLAVSDNKTSIQQLKEARIENILISHAFFPTVEYLQTKMDFYPKNLIIDSGAFSVWSRGESIDIDKYYKFCLNIKEVFKDKSDVCFVNLDVLPGKFGVMPTDKERIESARKGRENFLYLKKKGLITIPVFHQHEPFEMLEQMMKDADYIGLSPANDQSMKSKNNWLNKAFSIVKTKVKTHGFAVTSLNLLLRFPFYSADSSSWMSGGRYARIPTFKQGKLISSNFKNKLDLNKMTNTSDVSSIEMLNHYLPRMKQGALAYQQMQEFVTAVWAKRGIVFN